MEERIRRQGTNEAVRHRLIAEGKAEGVAVVGILGWKTVWEISN